MHSKEFYKSLLENIYEGIYFIDENKEMIFWNKGAERITGFSASEIVGRFCCDTALAQVDDEGLSLCKNPEFCSNTCPFYKTAEDGPIAEIERYFRHKKGHEVPVSLRSIAIKDDSRTSGVLGVFGDDTERVKIIKENEALKTLALKDQLTGLPNRRLVETFLDSRIQEFLSLDIPLGIAFIDIDNFKKFNDTYGHDAGDEVLKMVADTFARVYRSSDIIGRWGGEEFIAAFSGVDMKSLQFMAERLRTEIENTRLEKDGQPLQVTISIGATLFKETDTREAVIKRADDLLYQSKSGGRNKVTLG